MLAGYDVANFHRNDGPKHVINTFRVENSEIRDIEIGIFEIEYLSEHHVLNVNMFYPIELSLCSAKSNETPS